MDDMTLVLLLTLSACEPSTPANPAPSMSAEDEDSRLSTIFDRAGGSARGDVLESLAHEIAAGASKDLARIDAKAIETRCNRAGCVVTFQFRDQLDINARQLADDTLIGISQFSPVTRWMGRRLVGPLFHASNQLERHLFLIRDESDITF